LYKQQVQYLVRVSKNKLLLLLVVNLKRIQHLASVKAWALLVLPQSLPPNSSPSEQEIPWIDAQKHILVTAHWHFAMAIIQARHASFAAAAAKLHEWTD
jgi:hypothetical protein